MGKKNAVKILFIFIAFIVVIFVATINYKVHVSTSKIKIDTYEDKYKFKGIFIFQEYSSYHGNVDKNNMKVKAGQRVSKGTAITDGTNAPEAGIVVFNYDGWENKYNINNIKNITSKEIDSILKNTVKEQGIKIINNSEWFICAQVSSELSKDLKKGSSRDILINDNYYRIEVINNFKNSDSSFIVMKMKDDPETTDLHRGITGYIIRARYKGYIIPSDSITKYNGNDGVYIKSNGYTEIRLIKVLFKNEETAVVLPLENAINKLSEYDTVIRRPEHIKNGTKVR